MAFRSPLDRARGLGTAKDGTHHWLAQRVSAVALIPLTIGFVMVMVAVTGAPYEEALAIAKYLIFAPVMILFLAAGFWHGTLGLQVVIEDYIPRESVKIILLVLVKLTFTALAVIGIVAALKVSL